MTDSELIDTLLEQQVSLAQHTHNTQSALMATQVVCSILLHYILHSPMGDRDSLTDLLNLTKSKIEESNPDSLSWFLSIVEGTGYRFPDSNG